MSRGVIPFGPQNIELTAPVRIDVIVENGVVVKAQPKLGYTRRGIDELVAAIDCEQLIHIAERISGNDSFGHSVGYAQAVESMMNIEIPSRARYLRAIFLELSRVQSHLFTLALIARNLGADKLTNICWVTREMVLGIFEQISGSRLMLSLCCVGGFRADIDIEAQASLDQELDEIDQNAKTIASKFAKSKLIKGRLSGVAVLSNEEALSLGACGLIAKACGVAKDARSDEDSLYSQLSTFSPVIEESGDNFARVMVYCNEIMQSIRVVKEILNKIEPGEIAVNMSEYELEENVVESSIELSDGKALYRIEKQSAHRLKTLEVLTASNCNFDAAEKLLTGIDYSDIAVTILSLGIDINAIEQ